MTEVYLGSLSDLNPLYLQVGEVLEGLRALSEKIEIRHAQTEKLHDIMRTDVTHLRHEQRDLEEKLDCVICVMQHDLESLRAGALINGRSVAELLRVIQELKAPVSEIVALRSRVAGLLLAIGMFGSVAMWLAEPLYRWTFEQYYLKH